MFQEAHAMRECTDCHGVKSDGERQHMTEIMSIPMSLTQGMRKHLIGYVKLKKKNVIYSKH
jgi:hypothetical protein